MVAKDQTVILSTDSAEDDVATMRKTMATMTVIDDPGDPDVMLPELGMSSSSGSSTEASNDNNNSVHKLGEETSTTRDDGVLPTRETFENARMARTQHTRNMNHLQQEGEEREPSSSTHTREETSAHTRDSHTQFTAHTRDSHTQFTRDTAQTRETAQTRATTQTFQTYQTQGEESQFTYETFQTFATTGCETIGDASVEMKNALVFIQESVQNCLGVDIASEVKASMGEVEQKTAEIVEDRKEIWNVLLDTVEDQMIEQLGDHWLEHGGDEESKRRGRATRAAAAAAARKKKGGRGQQQRKGSSSSTGREKQRRSKERKSGSSSSSRERKSGTSRERSSRERAGRSRTRSGSRKRQQPEQPRDEARDDDVLVVDDDVVERTMLSEIQRAGSEDSPVGERSVLYFAA